MFLLDTNVISELRRPAKAHANVAAWASSNPAESFYLSAISVMEIDLGVLKIARRDRAQGAMLRSWLEEQVLPRFEDRILTIDVTVARRCAQLHVPNPRAERDAFIAATALVHGLTVVTRNISDFEPLGVALLNPWIGADEE